MSVPVEVIQDEALGWVIRLRGEEADRLRPEFEAWVVQSPAHRRAFDWAQGHFQDSETLKGSEVYGVSRWRTRRRWLYAAVAVAAALLVAYGLQSAPLGPFGASRAYAEGVRYTTGHGDIRTFPLADGSRITLDSDSRAIVALSRGVRRIRVDAGRLRLALAMDAPSIDLDAGAGAVRAEAGIVDLGYAPHGAVDVTLVQGRAMLLTSGSRPLDPGQVLRLGVSGAQMQAAAQGGADRRDWPTGWADYHAIRLDALVADANRYATKPIQIDDPATGALTASGRFKLTDTDNFAHRLAALFDLRLSHRADGLHLGQREK